MTAIMIPEPLVREIEELRAAGLIASVEGFAEQAIREKLSAARQHQFTIETQALQQDLAETGFTPELLVGEFERFRHAGDAAKDWPNHVIRDAAYLNWRYLQSPRDYVAVAGGGSYAVVGHKEHRGRPVLARVVSGRFPPPAP